MIKTSKIILAVSCLFIIAACSSSGGGYKIKKSSNSKSSSTTGWDYNDSKNGGFETNVKYKEQATGPGLMFVEGGSFTMGRTEQDVFSDCRPCRSAPHRRSTYTYYFFISSK